MIEAEAAAMVIPPFRIDPDPTAGGGRFVWMPGKPGEKSNSSVARALWLLHVPKAGTYHLWGRIQAPTPSDDSFRIRVRQRGRQVVPATDWHTGVHAEWEWTPFVAGADRVPRPIELAAGTALIEFLCREDGTRLDAFFLATGPDDRPPAGE